MVTTTPPVHKVALKDGRTLNFPRVGNGLPIVLKTGTTVTLLITDSALVVGIGFMS